MGLALPTNTMRRLVALVLALSFVGSTALSAQKPKKQKGKPKETQVTVVFVDTQREAARSYFAKQHGKGNCPPGLAKKNNGCLPPGQAKKRYVIGHPLPHGIVVGELPVELSVRIGPPPAGYRYGILDGDLVKLAVGTMLVVDAIEGLVR
jgi:Ni/Co efflux regulator RcnB